MPLKTLTRRTTLCLATIAFFLVSASDTTQIAMGQSAVASRMGLLQRAERVVFLGDSITFAGHYVAFFDAWLLTQDLESPPRIINTGLASETVSGLSEEGHAGGRFPRPDLAERLPRVLTATRPDLVIACYGMNCGIYQPLDERRFARYRQGIENLKRQVEAAKARLILITPPCYDDQRARDTSFSYNAVLGHYSQWLLSRREQGWLVVDLHGPMARALAERRAADPEFTFQRDAVHPDVEGHWVMARQLIRWFGGERAAAAAGPQQMLAGAGIAEEVLPLIRERMSVRRNAYLTAAGHERPGVREGLPLEQAEDEATRLTKAIRELIEKKRPR